jgi:DNA-binding transcriptional regulator YdaS (Cro superfamily)
LRSYRKDCTCSCMSDSTGLAALKRAIEILGTQGAAAAVIGVKQQTVSERIKSGKDVPAEWCIPLDLATQGKGARVPCHDLRPDLWPKRFNPKQDMRAA